MSSWTHLSLAKAPRCSYRKSSTCSNFNTFCFWDPQLPRGISSAQHPVCQEHHRRHLLCALLTAQPPFFLGTPLTQPPEEASQFSQSSLGRGAAHQSHLSCQSFKGQMWCKVPGTTFGKNGSFICSAALVSQTVFLCPERH